MKLVFNPEVGKEAVVEKRTRLGGWGLTQDAASQTQNDTLNPSNELCGPVSCVSPECPQNTSTGP